MTHARGAGRFEETLGAVDVRVARARFVDLCLRRKREVHQSVDALEEGSERGTVEVGLVGVEAGDPPRQRGRIDRDDAADRRVGGDERQQATAETAGGSGDYD